MQSQRKLFILIGINNTGTGVIQKFLNSNRRELQEQGLLYPKTGCVNDAHHGVSEALGFAAGKQGSSREELLLLQEELRAEIEKAGCETCIISSEYFAFPGNVLTVRKFFAGFDFRIVVYFRRHDHWWRSVYDQAVKTVVHPPWQPGFQSFFDFKRRRNPLLDNYLEQLDRWAQVFGKKKIIVRPYEHKQNQPNIIADFFAAIDRPVLANNIAFNDVAQINSPLDARSTSLLDTFQRLDVNDQARKALIDFVVQNASSTQAEQILSPKTRRHLIEQAIPQYESIAKQYLGRSDGTLFFEPLPDLQSDWLEPTYPTVVDQQEIVAKVLDSSDLPRRVASNLSTPALVQSGGCGSLFRSVLFVFFNLLAGGKGLFMPKGIYAPRPPTEVVVLAPGDSPSVDLYLPRRLEQHYGVTVRFVDTLSSAARELTLQDASMVVVVRHVPVGWLRRLLQHHYKLAGVIYLMDDDIPAAIAAVELPFRYAVKTSWRYARIRRLLTRLCSEVWVSTQELALRYSGSAPRIWEPEYFGETSSEEGMTVVYFYHGSWSHRKEIKWLVPIVRRVQEAVPNAWFEIIGTEKVKEWFRGIPRVRVVQPMPWKDYLAYAYLVRYQVGLAPCFDTGFNRARSHSKVFDITRLGASGIYSNVTPYAQKVVHGETGLLCANDQERWVEAITLLLKNRKLRRSLYLRAWDWCNGGSLSQPLL